jgi:hypothetical protein
MNKRLIYLSLTSTKSKYFKFILIYKLNKGLAKVVFQHNPSLLYLICVEVNEVFLSYYRLVFA